jgi:hypothetical protein
LVKQYLTFYRAIHTYQNRGTTAPHARPRDHLVIYTGEEEPELVEGESEVVRHRKPIQVALDPNAPNAEALLPASRLNLSKLHTIEHNIPVTRLGKITPRDIERLRQYCGLSSSTDRTSEALDDLDEDGEEGEY